MHSITSASCAGHVLLFRFHVINNDLKQHDITDSQHASNLRDCLTNDLWLESQEIIDRHLHSMRVYLCENAVLTANQPETKTELCPGSPYSLAGTWNTVGLVSL